MWEHRSRDIHPREHVARGMAGGLPGDAREERSGCGTDEASQTRSGGKDLDGTSVLSR